MSKTLPPSNKPTPMEIFEMRVAKWCMWVHRGASLVLIFDVNGAILFLMVLSPMPITMPVAQPVLIKNHDQTNINYLLLLPSIQFVEIKAKFFVRKGFKLVQLVELVCGLVSPVRYELSTLSPSQVTNLISAGTWSPPFTSTKSPSTKFTTSIENLCPSRITVHLFVNDFTMTSLWHSW